MLLSKLEAGEKGGGPKRGRSSGQNQNGAVMFPTLEIIVFLVFGFMMFVGVFV